MSFGINSKKAISKLFLEIVSELLSVFILHSKEPKLTYVK